MACSKTSGCTFLLLLAFASACAANSGRTSDQFALRDLVARFAYGADALAAQEPVSDVLALLRPLFTPQAKIRLFAAGLFDTTSTGVDAFVAVAKQTAYTAAVGGGQHLTGNHLVTFTGKKTANITSHFHVSVFTPDQQFVVRGMGYYYDTAVKYRGTWKLSSRQIITKNVITLKNYVP